MHTETILKLAILKLFKEGNNETEACARISAYYSTNGVSEKTINKWFEEFKSQDYSLIDEVLTASREKLMDEYLVDLINENPNITTKKLARLANCSYNTINRRVSKLKNGEEKANYLKKDNAKFTDEYLVNLINNNPDLSIEKLARIAKCSRVTVADRISKLNCGSKSANYLKKDNFKFTDEYLIELVDKNPDLNMRELAILAGVSQQTISSRIKQIKSMGKNIRYTCKNSLRNRSGANIWSNSKLTDEYIINLINKNPDLSIENLAILANTSYTTMWRRIKNINKYRAEAVYHTKDNKKFTDECLVNLINENPELNMDNLATLINTSVFTIFRRISKINDGDKVNYCKKSKKKCTEEHLINLINSNPGLNMAKLVTSTDISTNALCNRRKITIRGERINHANEEPKVKVKFTDEFLANLINENPELNMRELAVLAGTSTSTISKRIKKINSNGIKVKYVDKRK